MAEIEVGGIVKVKSEGNNHKELAHCVNKVGTSEAGTENGT